MIQKKPDWLKTVYNGKVIDQISGMLKDYSLHTVCQEANCPNIGECFKKSTATFLIMGSNCTRSCKFCNVSKNPVCLLDENEPKNVASASKQLNLKHVVITSVTRDDLEDGGAMHFAKTIAAVKEALPNATVEVLIPDLQGIESALDIIIAANPEIIGHNIETVPSLYSVVRPGANYNRSLEVLKYIKAKSPNTLTKAGIMLGLGETFDEVCEVIEDVAKSNSDILTIGQYLQPSSQHIDVKEFVNPEIFEKYKEIGLNKGLRYVYSSPLVRSSYNAVEVFNLLNQQ